MRARTRTLLPLLVVAGLLLAAASSPLAGIGDGKARAIEMGLIDIAQMQEDAVAAGLADAEANGVMPTPGASCTAGFAGPYPCENVDLLSVVPMAELGGPAGADVWGWTDSETGREIVISTTTYGAAFVDVTDPTAPFVMGRAYIGGRDDDLLWRDVKVYEGHAFVVSEHIDTQLQVFDLTQFRDVTSAQPNAEIAPVTVWDGIGDAHNIAINTETGFAYAVLTQTVCDRGMTMIDIRDPKNPTLAGCVSDEALGVEPGVYKDVHDAQCVIYRGPDTRYQGREICFTANEETGVFVVDVTDKSAPKILSTRVYDRIDYAHQGWLTADHRYWIFGDETDELLGGHATTATFTWNITDLENPGEVMTWEHETTAIDHNIYVEDGYVWQANYSAGLRVLDYTPESIANGEFTQVAYFDVDPGEDAPVFAGAWTAYPFFASGTIAVNSFDSGLFLLRANLPEKTVETPAYDGPAVAPGAEPAPEPAPEPEPAPTPLPATGGGLALIGIVLVGAALGFRRFGPTA